MQFVKGAAEVAQARIAYLKSGLSYIVLPRSKQFGGFMQAGITQPLRNGNAGLPSESAAKIKRAAPDLPA